MAALLALWPRPGAAAPYGLDPVHSAVTFSGGSPYERTTGVFRAFSAVVEVDESDLTRSRFLVEIDVASLETRIPLLDEALRGPGFLAAAKHPRAHIRSETITRTGTSSYKARCQVTLRGVTRPVTLTFWIHRRGASGLWLQGRTALSRRAFGIGEGPLASGLEDRVEVRFELALRRLPVPPRPEL